MVVGSAGKSNEGAGWPRRYPSFPSIWVKSARAPPSSRSAETERAYRSDWADFAAYAGLVSAFDHVDHPPQFEARLPASRLAALGGGDKGGGFS
jgi:hypothetical protein